MPFRLWRLFGFKKRGTMARTAVGAKLNPGEFVSLVALLMALVALAIDAVLPALPAIGRDLAVQRENNLQYVIMALFLGLSLGQITFGPISDSIGRKPAVYAGLFLFMGGCLISIFAPNFEAMVASRVLQGIGIAGPHTVTVALVRDQYEGRRMARLMSFAMAVFILVPTVAPAIGQVILWLGGWRSIFGTFLVVSAIAFAWFAIRQPETLPVGRRAPLSFRVIGKNVREVVSTRSALGFILAAGCVNAPFVAYLSSAQQIFQEAYKTGALFPAYFGALALAIGCASLANGRLVMKFGMRPLALVAAAGVSLFSVVALILAFVFNGLPPLWIFMAYLCSVFLCIGLLFGNLYALAMESLGHIAGVGAAVVASVSTFVAVPFGTIVGQSFDGTMYALTAAFAISGAGTLVSMLWATHWRGDRTRSFPAAKP